MRTPIRGERGEPIALEGIIDDITERRHFEDRLSFLAQYDVLTGLPNRTLFYDRLRHAVVRARREQTMVGLMFLDLDRFKQINDTLGHAASDRERDHRHGESLGLGLIAEGVETRAQLEFLKAAGCDAYQGYYFSVPLPAAAFAELVKKQVQQEQDAGERTQDSVKK